MWTASCHLISARFIFGLLSLYLYLCCPHASLLLHWQGCRHNSDRCLTGTVRGFCVIGIKWLMSSAGNSPKTPIFFSLQRLRRLSEMKRSKKDTLRDSTLLLADNPVSLLCLTVNRWLVLIDGRLPAQLSSEHQHPSVTIIFVITHQKITAAIHWQ